MQTIKSIQYRPSCRILGPIAASVLAASLTACGGGSSGGSSSQQPAAPVVQTGVFSDSPVAGLAYSSSSGDSGITDSNGGFQYHAGDTVTFSISGVTLGSTTGAHAVTPAHIGNGNDTPEFTNLLVMLQSLDTDGNPANGITLPASLDAAKVAAVVAKLGDDPATFDTAAANPDLAALSPTSTVVDRTTAAAHYSANYTTAIFAQAAGVWIEDSSFNQLFLRITASGRYALLDRSPQDASGQPGIEYGVLTQDATTKVITAANIAPDTNGTWGLSHPDAGEVLTMDLTGGKLVITSSTNGVFTFSRVQQVTNLIHGAWSLSPSLQVGAGMFVFLPGGQYVQANGAVPPAQVGCGQPGIESGTVAWDGIPGTQPSGVYSHAIVMNTGLTDTNGCAGLSGMLPNFAANPNVHAFLNVSADGSTMELTWDGISPITPVTFYRITP